MDDIVDLRKNLFETLRRLKDKENPIDIARARAVCQVADVIIDTAKVEIDFLRANGSVETMFFHKPLGNTPALPGTTNGQTHTFENGGKGEDLDDLDGDNVRHIGSGVLVQTGNVTTHRMK